MKYAPLMIKLYIPNVSPLVIRFFIPNYFIPLLFTMSMLCWGGHTWNPVQPFGQGGAKDALSVFGSGEAGAGMPGLGGWLSVWAYGPR